MFEQIENFRFSHRFQTRSEATVELIRRGLETLKEDKAENANRLCEIVFCLSDKRNRMMIYG